MFLVNTIPTKKGIGLNPNFSCTRRDIFLSGNSPSKMFHTWNEKIKMRMKGVIRGEEINLMELIEHV